jgi:putative ABC transport system permease protein
LAIPLLAGRAFSAYDRIDSAPVAIVSERLARRLFPAGAAVGQRIAMNASETGAPVYREIVGVVGATQREALGTADSLDVFLPYRQSASSNQYVVIRTTLPAGEFQRRVEQALWTIDSQQSFFDVRSYEERILDGVWQLRLSRYLLTIFGGVSLFLAAVGVYGLMSFAVAMQRREIGVRLALGAQPPRIRALILSNSGKLAFVGIAVGVMVSLALSSLVRMQITQIRGLDAIAYGIAAALVALAAFAASAIPAWRASRLDPLIALHGD